MSEYYLEVILVIPNEKERYIEDLLALANDFNVAPVSESIETGTRFKFVFSNIKSKNDFFNSIPLEWYE
jgi:hypothetical protein